MKPLEPNCLAYVTGGPDAGITVTCLQYAAPGFKYSPLNGSGVIETQEPGWIVQHPDSVTAIHAERDLMRIDGIPAVEKKQEARHA
ncbi:hypothetical protein [Halomonas sp. Mc5H-6]|uniref:hypothetical protein n=1 Tax=Halomonas sp. Mc5H-6 TaxID=2954500 RepID=UPI002097814D|nr:hypothetical protein [Halomonas sp. Mc5H-6]MCO7246394.1 hypothetical protein [Halomonas sp. Mc5H-6]